MNEDVAATSALIRLSIVMGNAEDFEIAKIRQSGRMLFQHLHQPFHVFIYHCRRDYKQKKAKFRIYSLFHHKDNMDQCGFGCNIFSNLSTSLFIIVDAIVSGKTAKFQVCSVFHLKDNQDKEGCNGNLITQHLNIFIIEWWNNFDRKNGENPS